MLVLGLTFCFSHGWRGGGPYHCANALFEGKEIHTTAQLNQDFLREPEQPMAWGPSQGYYGRFWGVSKIFPGEPWEIMAIKSSQPIEQCSNLAPKIYFCYVSWLRICQLFTVLTGVILRVETDCSRYWNNLYKSWVERALNSGQFGHFRFANHHFNWQIFIKVWTSIIGLSCMIRTTLEYEKVRQIQILFHGYCRW